MRLQNRFSSRRSADPTICWLRKWFFSAMVVMTLGSLAQCKTSTQFTGRPCIEYNGTEKMSEVLHVALNNGTGNTLTIPPLEAYRSCIDEVDQGSKDISQCKFSEEVLTIDAGDTKTIELQAQATLFRTTCNDPISVQSFHIVNRKYFGRDPDNGTRNCLGYEIDTDGDVEGMIELRIDEKDFPKMFESRTQATVTQARVKVMDLDGATTLVFATASAEN